MLSSTKRGRFSLRDVLHEVMEPYAGGPGSTRMSLAVDLLVLVLILGSCALVPLDRYYPSHAVLWWHLEVGVTALFVLEYLVRWYSAPRRLVYPFTLFALIDLVAILPTLLMLSQSLLMLRLARGIRLLRVLRLLRLLRLLKFLRYGALILRGLVVVRIWFSAVNHQYRLGELGRFCLYVLVTWVIGANLLHVTEIHLVGPKGPYADYWTSYWNIIIVLFSGIEDKEPVTLLGRVEVTAMLAAGIVIVGMLAGEIVAILVKKAERAGKIAIKPPKGKLAQHIVVLGANKHLDPILKEIYEAIHGQHYILVVAPGAEDLPAPDPQVYRRVFALSGDPVRLEVLQQAQLSDALRVVVLSTPPEGEPLSHRDDQTLMETIAVVTAGHQVPVVVELHDPRTFEEVRCLEEAGAEFVLSRRFGEGLISQTVLNPGVTEVYDQLLTFVGDNCEFYAVPVPQSLVGARFEEAQLHFLEDDREPVVVVGIDRPGDSPLRRRFWINPVGDERLSEQDLVLGPGDGLLVIADERPHFAQSKPGDLWSGVAALDR